MLRKKVLRKITREKLFHVLREHRKWVETKGNEGQVADLSYTDLHDVLNLTDTFPGHGQYVETGGLHGTRANLQDINLRGADLRGINFRWADLRGADFRESNLETADFTKSKLNKADIRGANLSYANFEYANVSEIKYSRWKSYKGIRVATCFGSPLFRRFAQDQEYIEEFRSSWWRKPIYLFWLIFSDCGRSFWLWAGWSIFFALLFGNIFYYLGEGAFAINSQLPNDRWTYVYYSVVTFTTLGFGDITPNTPCAAKFVMVEVILGYVMLGGLISILANKLARRS